MTEDPTQPKRSAGSMLSSLVAVSGVSGLAMVVGCLMNIAVAAIIGATSDKDAYDVASHLPRMMLFMFGLDLFRGISTSLFSRLAVNKTGDPNKIYSTLLNCVIFGSIAAVIVAELFAGPLVRLIGPGLSPETTQYAITLTRFLIPTLALTAVTTLLGSILLAYHYYGLTESLSILPKLTMLIGVLIWGKTLGVWILVIALSAGLLMELPVMFYFLKRSGLKYSLSVDLKSPSIRSVFIDAIPLAIGVIATYLSGILMQRTVSRGPEGTVACFNYSLQLCGMLTALACRPVYTALAPRISRSLEAENYSLSGNLLGKSLTLITVVCLASISVIWAEAPILVDVVLGRGKFAIEAIEKTSGFLVIMFTGVIGIGIRMPAVAVLLAKRKTRAIMVYTLIAAGIRTVAATYGQRWWGTDAAAVAYASGVLVNGLLSVITAIVIVKLYRRMTDPVMIIRWVIACTILVVLPMLPHAIYPASTSQPFATKFIHLVIVAMTAGLAILLASWLVQLYDLKKIVSKSIGVFKTNK